MTTKQIKDFTQDSSPANSDLFLKSNTDGGLTTISFENLKNRITENADSMTLLTANDDLDAINTVGTYYVSGSLPKNWPDNFSKLKWAIVEVKNEFTNIVKTVRPITRATYATKNGKNPWEYNSLILEWDGVSEATLVVPEWSRGVLLVGQGYVSHISVDKVNYPTQPRFTNIAGDLIASISASFDSGKNQSTLTMTFNRTVYGQFKVV